MCTDKNNISYYFKISIGLLILCLSTFFTGRLSKTCNIISEERIDTVIDTLVIESIILDTVEVIRKDVVYLPKVKVENDTITVTDSVYVEIPISNYTFQSPGEYKLEATGYNVEISSIQVYPKTIYKETVKVKKDRWGLGIQLGVGATYRHEKPYIQFSPYIGVGIQYNIITF